MVIERWLTVAGFGTWLVSGLPTLLRIVNGQMSPGGMIVWAIAFPLFGLAFGLMCLQRPGIWQRTSIRRVLLVLQAGAGLAMTSTAPDVFPAGTLVVVAGQLDEVPPRVAVAWMIVQTVALALIGFAFASPVVAWAIAGAFGGFQLFAFVTASLTSRERQAREELGRMNSELLATRGLLAESSRNAERLRISRDLHDTLGPHLTALSLQLDVTSRLAEGKAAEHARQAYAITPLLLSDVRDVVSELRGSSRFDLGRAIRTLAAESSALAIHLDLPDVLEIEEGAQADALLKCVQEIITNTRRHAAALNLWIHVEPGSEGIALHARDDGRRVKTIAPGNGLTGMRERFEEFAGRVEFRAATGTGSRCMASSLLELAGDIDIVAEAADGEDGLTVIAREHPDVVLLDVRMPGKGGLDVLRALQAANALPPTILLTTFDDDEALMEAVKVGARGYLLKDVSLERLTDAIRAVAAGGTVIRPALTERVLRGLEHVRRDFDALSPPDPLTKREIEILRLIAGGYSNREIAGALGTAEGTVKNHASSILSKLGVRDRTRAVLKALELGYL